jgi:hypothetical protein
MGDGLVGILVVRSSRTSEEDTPHVLSLSRGGTFVLSVLYIVGKQSSCHRG